MDTILQKEFLTEKLSPFQKDIFEECLVRKSGGLSLTMGSGKTIVSLAVSLFQAKKEPVIVVVSKTLLSSWIEEIKKFYGDTLSFKVLHQDYSKKLDELEINAGVDQPRVFLTTPEFLSKVYKDYNIENYLVHRIAEAGGFEQTQYVSPMSPFLNVKMGTGLVFSIKWGAVVIDEIQRYTKITSVRGRAISSLYSKNRWGLSGTMFDEPTPERILGYHTMLNIRGFPRSLVDASEFVKSKRFKGILRTLVFRDSNVSFIPPKVNKYIVENTLTPEENVMYMSVKDTMKIINEKLKEFERQSDVDNRRLFSSYLLASICYLRQSVISCILPIASATIDMADLQSKSFLSKTLMGQFQKLNLVEYLEDPANVMSTRIKSILNVVNKNKTNRIVLFSSFKSCLNLIQTFMPIDRTILTIESWMSIKVRENVISQFRETENAILLLTYGIGAEGLNLQCSNTVLLTDFYWNTGKTDQAVARVLRYGQEAREVNVYFFTSNTGIEKALFEKHFEKITVINEIQHGNIVSKIQNFKINEILKIITNEETNESLKKIIK